MFARLFLALLLVFAAMFSALMFAVNMVLGELTAGILWIVSAGLEMLFAVFLGTRTGSNSNADEQDE